LNIHVAAELASSSRYVDYTCGFRIGCS